MKIVGNLATPLLMNGEISGIFVELEASMISFPDLGRLATENMRKISKAANGEKFQKYEKAMRSPLDAKCKFPTVVTSSEAGRVSQTGALPSLGSFIKKALSRALTTIEQPKYKEDRPRKPMLGHA